MAVALFKLVPLMVILPPAHAELVVKPVIIGAGYINVITTCPAAPAPPDDVPEKDRPPDPPPPGAFPALLLKSIFGAPPFPPL